MAARAAGELMVLAPCEERADPLAPGRLGAEHCFSPPQSGAAGGEFVLEGKKVEEVEHAIRLEVDSQIARGEEVLESKKVKEIQRTVAIQIDPASEVSVVRGIEVLASEAEDDPIVGIAGLQINDRLANAII
jgi:hypothetical protein